MAQILIMRKSLLLNIAGIKRRNIFIFDASAPGKTALGFSNNIFEKDFDADPEVKEESNISEAKMPQEENPLFNNNLANTTIDDVMANNNVDSLSNSNNDFWFSNEEAPMDLNSLPDISTDTNNNTFFGDNNNFMSDLEFPSLNMNFDDKEESHEN